MADSESEKNQDLPQNPSRRRFLKLGLAGIASLAAGAFGLNRLDFLFKGGTGNERLQIVIPAKKVEAEPVTSPEETLRLYQDLNQKIEGIYQMRKEWNGTGTPYTVQSNDTLPGIIEKHKITTEKILERNPSIQQNSNQVHPNQELIMPENVVPTPALGKIFDQVQENLKTVQAIVELGKQLSQKDQEIINNLNNYLIAAPGRDNKYPAIEYPIDPEAKNREWVLQEVKSLFACLPNSEQIVSEIQILSRDITWKRNWGEWEADMGCHTFKDRRAVIYVADHPKGAETWERKSLLQDVMHEFAHTLSLYSEGYNLQLLSPAKIINLVFEDTQVTDKSYKRGQEKPFVSGDQEEDRVVLTCDLLVGRTGGWDGLYPGVKQPKMDFIKHWLSEMLGTDIDLIEIGRKLQIRN
ncbi:MAG: LysM domain-containing protein [Candidatus Daviesbacteria bacterium]